MYDNNVSYYNNDNNNNKKKTKKKKMMVMMMMMMMMMMIINDNDNNNNDYKNTFKLIRAQQHWKLKTIPCKVLCPLCNICSFLGIF